ncbi:M13-type metalloendopeptidase [Streptomyces minutiscleroticus]|uniref:Zinc metalloprotease n=1 Tax=Streptomyces minutiscleroticus TaxID=68238 RepID=A0A918NM55_9ACTN|nr:M13 family metallopeptidase [Streptomyces minutiscleroticus]GGX80189.1 zinc metalloprotease [Streptomyces minutiscleroticus]
MYATTGAMRPTCALGRPTAESAQPRLGDLVTDPSVRPQDDFHRYANGPWSDAFVLPEDRAEATLLSLLAEEVEDDVARLIRRAASAGGNDADRASRAVADLYTSFMDEEAIEASQADPLAEDLAGIRTAPDRRALALVLGRLQAQGVRGALEPSVFVDPADGSRYALTLTASGLGLPRPELYRADGDRRLLSGYARHVRTMLAHAGLPASAEAAEHVVRAETALAHLHMRAHGAADMSEAATPSPPATGVAGAGARPSAPAADSAAPHTSSPVPASPRAAEECQRSVGELRARDRGFPWADWLRGLGEPAPEAIARVRPAGFLVALEDWWAGTDLHTLRLWLAWRYVHEMAPFGPRAVFAEHFRWYWRELTGARRPWPRARRASAFVQTALGEVVGDRYLREHLTPGTLTAARHLVNDLVGTYRRCLQGAQWMRPDTRRAALAKLDAMRFDIGAPAVPAGCADLRTDPTDLLGNVKRSRAWHIARELNRLGGPVDHSDWKVLPQSVTAYYRHSLNQVVIPAALLRPPVFDAAGDRLRNIAVLGSIVCHEMSHAFDHRGSHYDGHGRRHGWWAAEDRAEFERRSALLVRQYDGYTPGGADGARVNGARTLGENIADITGLAVAQQAFAAHLGSLGVSGEPHRRQMRRFFLAWATMWRAGRTRGRMLERLAHDFHAPPEFRCNGVLGHIPAFYEAFDVTETDRLYIPPEARFSLLG